MVSHNSVFNTSVTNLSISHINIIICDLSIEIFEEFMWYSENRKPCSGF